jgi:hypothetical protein
VLATQGLAIKSSTLSPSVGVDKVPGDTFQCEGAATKLKFLESIDNKFPRANYPGQPL